MSYSQTKRPVPFFVWASPILFLLLAALQWTAFGSLLGYLGERRFAKPRTSK